MKLAIFDLDGTLLDTIDDLGDSCNHVLQQNNYPIHEIESKYLGRRYKEVDRTCYTKRL